MDRYGTFLASTNIIMIATTRKREREREKRGVSVQKKIVGQSIQKKIITFSV
jgi:hypothetical protein